MKNKKLSKVSAAVIAGCIILSTVGVSSVSAATTTKVTTAKSTATTANSQQTPRREARPRNNANMLADLKAAVTAGIITQAESDSINTYLASNKTAKTNLFADLVTAKVLTQEKADALKAYFDSQRAAKELQQLTTAIAKLVTDKTITQDQADKIIAAVNAAEADRKAAFDKAASMSEADRKAFLDSFKASEVNPLTALVTNGTITQVQADKISPALHLGKGPGGAAHEDRSANLQTTLSNFVANNTITQIQADKIAAAYTAAEAARKAALDKAATMADVERKNYLDSFHAKEVNPLTGLVANGTITQAQADKIGPSLHFGGGPGRDGRGPHNCTGSMPATTSAS